MTVIAGTEMTNAEAQRAGEGVLVAAVRHIGDDGTSGDPQFSGVNGFFYE